MNPMPPHKFRVQHHELRDTMNSGFSRPWAKQMFQRFLKSFEDNGKGKGVDSLKFTAQFAKSVEDESSTKVESNADMYTVGQILSMNGLQFKDFDPEAAVKIAERICQDCYAEFQIENPPDIAYHDEYPALTKMFYKRSLGTTTRNEQTEKRVLKGTANLNDMSKLKLATDSLAITGFSSKGALEDSSVTVENARHQALKKQGESLQTT